VDDRPLQSVNDEITRAVWKKKLNKLAIFINGEYRPYRFSPHHLGQSMEMTRKMSAMEMVIGVQPGSVVLWRERRMYHRL
jgi:hypothetical protein